MSATEIVKNFQKNIQEAYFQAVLKRLLISFYCRSILSQKNRLESGDTDPRGFAEAKLLRTVEERNSSVLKKKPACTAMVSLS
jgi:hypothetical protein